MENIDSCLMLQSTICICNFSYILYYFIYLKQCIFLMTTMMMMRERRGKRKMKNIKEKQFIKKISNFDYLFWI